MKVSHGRLATVAQENRENLARAVCVPTEVQTWPGQCVFPLKYKLGQGSVCSHWCTNLARAVCVPCVSSAVRTYTSWIHVRVVTAWPNLLCVFRYL